MRATIAYYMLILYVTVMFKPLIPIAQDFLSHTFSEAIHIATVHAIYGSNHLQKELSESNSDNENTKHSNSTGEDQVTVHVTCDVYGYYFDNIIIGKAYSSFNQRNLIPGFLSKHSPPPKFSC